MKAITKTKWMAQAENAVTGRGSVIIASGSIAMTAIRMHTPDKVATIPMSQPHWEARLGAAAGAAAGHPSA